jgi:hypothetical protein
MIARCAFGLTTRFHCPMKCFGFRGDSLSSSTMLSLSGTSLPSASLHTKEIVQSVGPGVARVRIRLTPCTVREAEEALRAVLHLTL